MKTELLEKSPLLALPLGALFVFLAVFLVAFVVVMKKKSTAYDGHARLPLEDGDANHEGGV